MGNKIASVDQYAPPALNRLFAQPSILDMTWVVPGANGHEIMMVNPVALPPAIRTKTDAIMKQSLKHDLPVRPAFAAETFKDQVILDVPGTDKEWGFWRVIEDPLYLDKKDGFPVPSEIKAQVARTQDILGKPFDDFYIAHEMIKGVRNGGPVTAAMIAPPPSKKAQQKAQKMGNTSLGIWKNLDKFGKGVVRTSVEAVVGTATTAPKVAAGIASALAALDPILFGIIKDPSVPLVTGTPALFFYITHWDYSEPNVKALPAREQKLLSW